MHTSKNNADSTLHRWGLKKTLYRSLMRLLERYLGLHVFAINARELDPNAPLAELPPGESIRYLEPQDFDEIYRSPKLNISQAMASDALARGDRCIGYFDGSDLVSYFWCATAPTPMEAGLWVRFPAGFSYAYKALTLASHRGRRLQQALTHANDVTLTKAGLTHNIEYIAGYNYPQLTASARYGNRTLGYAGYLARRGRTLLLHSPGVRHSGFKIFQK